MRAVSKELCEQSGHLSLILLCGCVLQFPYCDGTHNTHNKETGDNVGPLKVTCEKKKEEKKKSK